MINEIYEILSYFDKEIVHITKDLNKMKVSIITSKKRKRVIKQ
jgi:hypothetical protein